MSPPPHNLIRQARTPRISAGSALGQRVRRRSSVGRACATKWGLEPGQRRRHIHSPLVQICASVCDAGTTLNQQRMNVWCLGLVPRCASDWTAQGSANARHSPGAGSMLAQRRRGWDNVKPTLSHCLCPGRCRPGLSHQTKYHHLIHPDSLDYCNK